MGLQPAETRSDKGPLVPSEHVHGRQHAGHKKESRREILITFLI